MTRTDLVLAVIPDRDFRHSVVFALGTEGFAVDTCANLSEALASLHVHDVACIIVDDKAVDDWRLAADLFSRFAKPIVLLISFLRPIPELSQVTFVTKPFLGAPLIEAVRHAVAGN